MKVFACVTFVVLCAVLVAMVSVLLFAPANAAPIARVNLSGDLPATDPDYIAGHWGEFDILVIGSRPALESGFLLLPHQGRIFIYYSAADQWLHTHVDGDRWRGFPQASYEYKIGHTVDEYRAWMPLEGMERRRRGKDPVTQYWPGGALLNMTNFEFGEQWAATIGAHHKTLEAIAGRQLDVFLDNAWDAPSWINSLNENPIDYNSDGVGDSNAALNAAWYAGTRHAFAALRGVLPGRVFIGNGTNTYTESLNGRMVENFGKGHRDLDAEMLNLGLPWREPNTNIVHGTTDVGLYVYGSSLVLPDAAFAMSEGWDLHSSVIWGPLFELETGPPSSIPSSVDADVWSKDWLEVGVVVDDDAKSADVYTGPPWGRVLTYSGREAP